MEKYLEGEEITKEELKAAIRKATVNVEFYPSYLWICIQKQRCSIMLDAVVDYLPSPLDVPAIKGTLSRY